MRSCRGGNVGVTQPAELAVVLAGGEGTRLRSVVGDTPKSLAPVSGKPFLYWLFSVLRCYGVKRVLLLLGRGAEKITTYCENTDWPGLDFFYSTENSPLDKAGALRLALPLIKEEHFLFMNGDTLLEADLGGMARFHTQNRADVTFAVRKWPDISRSDTVGFDSGKRVFSFGDKRMDPDSEGMWPVNGGVYMVRRKALSGFLPEGRLSWESDVAPAMLRGNSRLFAYETDGYFIDIGVPDDYGRAQDEIPAYCQRIGAVHYETGGRK